MKTKRFVIALLLLVGLFQPQIQAQDKLYRNIFHGSPKMRGGLYTGLYGAMFGSFSAIVTESEAPWETPTLRWLLPTSEMDLHIPAWSLTQSGNDVPLEKADWWSILYPDLIHNYNFAVGYEFSWKSLEIPLGAYVGADVEWRQICFKEGMIAGKHRMTFFVPSAGLRFRLLGNGFERKNSWNIVLDCGAAYSYAMKYKNFYQWDTNALGNGFRPRIGLIFSTLDHGSFYVRWEKDMYELFNNDFTLPDGRKPFDNMHSEFYSIILGWALFI